MPTTAHVQPAATPATPPTTTPTPPTPPRHRELDEALAGLTVEIAARSQSPYVVLCTLGVQTGGPPELTVQASVPDRKAPAARVPLAGMLAGTVLRGLPLIASREQIDAEMTALLGSYGPVESAIVVPLSVQGTVVGLLALADRPGGYPTAQIARLQPLLHACACLAAQARDLQRDHTTAAEKERLFDLALDYVVLTEPDGALRRVNPAFLEETYYSEGELLARPLTAIVHPDDIAQTRQAMEQLSAGRTQIDFENRIRRKDGVYRVVAWRARALDGGELVYAVGRDVTLHKLVQEELDRFFTLSSDFMAVVGFDGHIKRANPALQRANRRTSSQLRQASVFDLVHPDDRAATLAVFERLARGESVLDFETRALARDGSVRRVAWRHTPVPGQALAYAVGRDVTEIRRAQEELERLFALTPDAITITAPDGSIVRHNPAYEKLSGRTAQELEGMLAFDVVHPDDADSTRHVFAAMAQGKPVMDFECRIVQPSGEVRWASWRAMPSPETGLAYGIGRDITEFKQAQEDLQRFFHLSQDAMCVVGVDGMLRRYNPAMERAFGAGREKMLTTSVMELAHPDDRERAIDELSRLVQGARDSTFECRIVNGEGDIRWFSWRSTSAPELGVFYTVGRDVTEAKRAHEHVDRIFSLSPDVMTVVALDGRVLRHNPAYEKLLGLSGEEIQRVRAMDTVHPDDRAATEQAFEGMARGEPLADFECRVMNASGEARLISWRAAPVTELALIYAIGRDVTEMRQAQQELDRFFNLSEDMMAVVDVKGLPVRCNPAVERAFGGSREELMATPVLDWTHPDDRKAVQDHFARLGEGKTVTQFECRVVSRQGDVRWIAFRSTALPELGVAYSVGRDVTGMRQAQEELTLHRDHLQGLVEHQTKDLLRAKEAAEAANRAKSAFLANMSHELRTPMHAVLSFARLGLQRQEWAPREKLGQYMGMIVESGTRLLTMLNDLLDLAKLESGKMVYEMREASLLQVVQEALREYGTLCTEKGVTVEIEPPPESSIVYMDPARMGQVVRNLLSNAIKFTPSQRQVHLRLKPALIPNGRRRQERGDAPAWLLEVSDEGVGIPEGELSAVFDKFIQSSKTRTGAGGTGLGLAICTEIVAEHRGRIWAENNAAGGATFKLLLPQDTRNLRHEPRQAATPAR